MTNAPLGKRLKIIQHPYGNTDADQLESFRQEYSKEADIYMNANTILFPDTLPTLTHLKKQGIRIGIISTKYRFRILSFLRNHMPDDWFDIIIGGEDVTHHKPILKVCYLPFDRLKAAPKKYYTSVTVQWMQEQPPLPEFLLPVLPAV